MGNRTTVNIFMDVRENSVREHEIHEQQHYERHKNTVQRLFHIAKLQII